MGEEVSRDGIDEDELAVNRFRLQASIWDPATVRHLETIGVARGWKCLEVGAGQGSIAQWLSQRVGLTGKVVATDIDARFLKRISAPNLEIRQHDILRDELEAGLYDVVNCRFLLEHLAEPEKAVKRMAHAVRPNGWLLVEEHDWSSMSSLDVADPSLTPLATKLRALFDSLRNKGIADMYIGRRVRGFIEGLRFVDVGQEGWTCMVRGGEPMARVHAASMQMVARMLTKDEAETLQRLYMDPAFMYPSETVFSAWGRKPVEKG